MEKWIFVKDMNGNVLRVRATDKYVGLFVTENGDVYHVTDLDFTYVDASDDYLSRLERVNERNDEDYKRTQEYLRSMMESLDAVKLAERQTEIAEREYWRRLRGDVFLAIWREYRTRNDACDVARQVVDTLYKQDCDFIENLFNTNDNKD